MAYGYLPPATARVSRHVRECASDRCREFLAGFSFMAVSTITTKSMKLMSATESTHEIEGLSGQRTLPSLLMRVDRLEVVASSQPNARNQTPTALEQRLSDL